MNNKFRIKLVCIFTLLILLYVNLISEATFNMSYLYGNYDYVSLVSKTKGALNEVSPSYFDINTDGTLKLNSIDINFVNAMHSMGVKVVPFLSNHWDRTKGRTALNNREYLAEQIVEAINTYDLDGVNIDIENVTETSRDSYTDFVKIVREKLPSDKTVSVAVAANPNNWTAGWHASYDYSALAEYADYLMIMAYDEHYESGTSGPVASINFTEESIKYALTKIAKDKIVLGIPFYGRYWKEGATTGGYGVSLNKIEEILSKYESTVTYDEVAQSVKAVVNIKSSDTKPIINGKTLTTGTYTFWYENEQSIKSKLELINKYELKGSGSWSLGQETADTWEYYGVNIAEKYEDVSEDDWFYEAVMKAKKKGLMKGKTNKKFYPNDGLTRAEFTVVISRMLEIEVTESEDTYIDTTNHWAKNYIEAVTKAGYMEGKQKSKFYPDSNITREEAAKVLSLIDITGEIKNESMTYKDLSKNRWSYNYIIDVSRKGLIMGYPDGNFMPSKMITRSEIAEILARIL